jgi:Tol biopolymer transport system component
LRGIVPGAKDLLVASVRPQETWIEVLSRETGTRRRLLRGGGNTIARLTRTGQLVYSDADTIFTVPVDPERFLPLGPPVPAIHGIDHYYRHANAAISDNGTLAFLPADGVREPELFWLDRAGHITPVPGGRGSFGACALSPDDREAACERVDGAMTRVWVLDLERGATRLLAAEGDSGSPIWSRDGMFITYARFREGKFTFCRKRADGTGVEETLITDRSGYASPEDWSPDGRSLLFTEYTNRGDADVWLYSGGQVTPFIATPFTEEAPRFSPDGRFVAFSADDGGESHVYVQPFPGPAPRTPVSTEDSGSPRWSADGRQLYYNRGPDIMGVPVQTDPVLRLGPPQRVVGNANLLDPTRDGRRFLSMTPRTAETPIELRVVLNWFEELERLAPHPQR